MLCSLHIRNYILIDSLEVEFPEGLVIITGQTGAGKSILLGALSLLGGARADASMIGRGADNCVVEAEFSGLDDSLQAFFDENGVEWDGGNATVRRVIAASGRSRSFVNDSPVSVGMLSELSDHLFDIHSQHKSLLLSDRNFQLGILDHFAGNGGRLPLCRESWRRLGALRSELESTIARMQRLQADRDYNAAQWEQLDAARLCDGELEELEEEQKQLAHAGQIKEGLRAASALFEPLDGMSIDSSLKEARRHLERVAEYLPAASELAARIDSARIELSDIFSEVDGLDAGVVDSSARLEQVEDRMSELYSLLKKHSCATVAELIEVRDKYSQALFDSSSVEERISDLHSAIAKEQAVYDKLCTELGEARRAAAPAFGSRICSDLHFLELDRAAFEVCISPAPAGPSGTDAVSFLFSSTGDCLQDVSKCASGGEISRIMLCLKAMMARFVGMPTLIFDEIDTGVSGSVADKMGQMICSMGKDMQVFSITHLPQVAAKGNAHYTVTKSEVDGRTVSVITELSAEQRVKEIARLLSGAVVTEAALANARELLKGC